jgi:hypothetical protein
MALRFDSTAHQSSRLTQQTEYCQAPLTLLTHSQYYTWGGHGKLFT